MSTERRLIKRQQPEDMQMVSAVNKNSDSRHLDPTIERNCNSNHDRYSHRQTHNDGSTRQQGFKKGSRSGQSNCHFKTLQEQAAEMVIR